ncbi:MAG TPA: NADAR family protein [Longimicrobium sp.]|nr:NADAR family protein [Longimicrobium sp.]
MKNPSPELGRDVTIDEPRDLAALQAAIAGGWAPRYLFFWGHTAKDPASVGKECLSQWYPAAFEIDGVRYATAEHWMMAEKARLFGDHAAAERVLAAPHPGAAKRVGREVRGFDAAVWEERRFGIVVAGNRARFTQHAELGRFLLGTSARVLVEASPVDRVWGIGLAADDPRATDPRTWDGLNLLGFALMQVRAELAGTDAAPG